MATPNPPAIVEVTRGNFVESTHLVDIVIADGDGTIVAAWGDPEIEIFPRSAIKALQALPLIESGAADAFGFDERHLALACSSHNGEPMHVQAAHEMLARSGLGPECLECGKQHPRYEEDIAELAASGQNPSAVHNNCSGKHSGFLAVATHLGQEPTGYVSIEHPVQKLVAETMEELTGIPHRPENCAIDGCSIPTYRLPLTTLATVFARFGTGEKQSGERSQAMARLRDACFAHPEMVAGKKRACTKIMQALKDRAFVKIGAEGVYTASLPESGLGIALKVRDGAMRAAEVAISEIVLKQLELPIETEKQMLAIARPKISNLRDICVGEIKIKNIT